MASKSIMVFIFLCIGSGTVLASSCKPRDFGVGSIVCVCDENHCDFMQPLEPHGPNEAVIYTSDKAGRRLERSTVQKRTQDKISTAPITITIDPSTKYQGIEGFGGAFTDAVGINLNSLSSKAQELLLRSYFSKDGIEYTIGRVPISSSDFSAKEYSYDDVKDDFELKHFSLTEEDIKYKIPYIKLAQQYSNRPIRLFGSSWSAPAWMKANGRMHGAGVLLGEPKKEDPYYTTWANYYVKFLQEYAKHNISFWTLTAQNEPMAGFLPAFGGIQIQTQGFTADMQKDFIKNNLGPALRKNGFGNVSIMILDDQRPLLPWWAREILNDPEASQYVSHIGVHYYEDKYVPTSVLDETHQEFPNIPLLGTEACVGGPKLGSWENAEVYAHDIIEDLNHWFVGWLDWNLALDLQGGPNWAKNFMDSPIIVNATAGEFYKQPIFYVMGHFSKFLPPGSHRIAMKAAGNLTNVEVTAFMNADGYKTVIILNKNSADTTISISEADTTDAIDMKLSANSLTTVLWK